MVQSSSFLRGKKLIAILVVVGLLVIIGLVGYPSWMSSVRTAQIKDTLQEAAAAMEKAYALNSSYPSLIPSNISSNQNVSLTGGSSDGKTYCIDATDPNDSSVHYYIDQDTKNQGAQIGTCAGRQLGLSAPSNLVANVVSDTSINLSWDAVSKASSYILERSTDLAFTSPITIATQPGTSFSSINLLPTTKYYYRVQAANLSGNSDWSDIASATTNDTPAADKTGESASSTSTDTNSTTTSTPATTPAEDAKPVDAPMNPVVTVTLNGSNILASVTPVTCTAGIVQYAIRSRVNEGAWSSYNFSTSRIATQPATEGIKYGYQAQARCYVSASAISSATSGVESTYTKPVNAPSGDLNVFVFSLDDNSAAVVIDDFMNPVTCSAGTVQYGIASNENGGSWSNYSNWSTTTFVSKAINEGVKYGFRAQARCYVSNMAVSSAVTSAEVNHTHINVPSTPTISVGLNGSDVQAIVAPVTCTAGTAQYAVSYRLNDSDYWSPYTDWSTDTTYTQTANEGVKYGYVVQARCYSDVDAISDTVTSDESTYTQPVNAPAASNTSVDFINDNEMFVSSDIATCGAGVAQYKLDYQRNDGGWNNDYSSWSENATGYYTGNYGSKNDYRTEARCYVNDSLYSDSVTGDVGTYTLPIPAPSSTTAVSSSTVGSTTTFSWSYSCPVDTTASYQYRYTITPLGYDSNWTATDLTSFDATTSTASQTYQIQVQAKCSSTFTASDWGDIGTASYYKAKTWKQLSGGEMDTCGIASDDKVYCWGSNQFGVVGNGLPDDVFVPTAVNTTGVLNGKTILSVSVGKEHVCVVASDNKAYCWGDNSNGQLGNGTTGGQSNVPVAVDTTVALSGKTIKNIVSSYNTTCAIASDNHAYCWGANNKGQLGNGTTSQSNVPVAVDTTGLLSGKTVKSIDVGFAQTCVVASDNHAYCWGDNTMGQLGDGTTNESDVPVAVSTTGIMSGKTILTIAAHQSNHTCAIASDNLAYCWGNNWSGQLGNDQDHQFVNTAITAVDMTGVLSGMTIKSLYAVVNHTCAIASDDNAYCWGQNDSGNIGNGNNNSYSYPVAVYTGGALSGRTIKSIASGWSHVCAIASDDNSYCWGQNQGAFGNGDGMNSFYPVHTFAAP